MKHRLYRLLAAALLCSAPIAATLAADDYPSHPIHLLVGFAAGGPTDIIARVLAKDMSLALGQSIYVENKPGASSMIATREVKNAAPDGYSVLFASLGLNVNPILFGAQAGYQSSADFAPIANAATLPLVAVVAYDSPLNSMQDLIKKAKTSALGVTFASSGNGGSGHLAGELLATRSHSKMVHVPFRGNSPALMEVMSGRVDFMFYPIIGLAENVAAKRLKILAVGTATRMPRFPDSPTMAEVGFPGFEVAAPWVGLLAPAKTPPAVVARLNDAMLKALAKPAVKAQLEKLGAVIVGDSPAQFTLYLKHDYTRWADLIKAADIKGM